MIKFLSKDGKFYMRDGKLLGYTPPLPPPSTLAANSSWYKGTTDKSTITAIEIKDSYTPTGTVTEQWNADVNNDGSIKSYVEDTKLTIAGNGAGKIMANADSSSAFNGFSAATSISGLNLLNTSKVTNMSSMFSYCNKLTSLDVSSFDTSNVTNMSKMFYGVQTLISLDVSDFDTSNVTDMNGMFRDCSALTNLNLSGWNISKVTDMFSMFDGCSALTSLNLSGWDTSNVTYMNQMFRNCKVLTKIYASGLWSTASVTSSTGMFGDCSNLSGAISYNSNKVDATYANYTTGYLTYKAAPTRSMSIMSSGSDLSN